MDNAVIVDTIKRHDEQIKEHDKRLDKVEQANVEFKVQIKNLCEKIAELTNWIKALFVAIVTASIGFLIWYIQSLPR